jgi:hypothetical protein
MGDVIMKKYTFSERVGKKTTKYEIVAETLEDAQVQLIEKLEAERGTPLLNVGLPDYIEPIDPPTDVTLKTYHITFSPDEDSEETETITYKAQSLFAGEGKFLEDFPEQAGKPREIHLPLSNNAVDRENEKKSENPKTPSNPFAIRMTNLFKNVTTYVKLFTMLLFGIIAIDLLVTAIFGKGSSLGVIDNITVILGQSEGLSGIIVLFLLYFLFIRSESTTKK